MRTAAVWREQTPRYKFRHSISVHGHREDELISAVQKSIRRGNEPLAVYAALEIDRFVDYAEAKAFVTRFANRLRVTLLEDIGVAEFWQLAAWHAQIVQYLSERERWAPEVRQQRIANVVAQMARARKIRLVSDIKAVFFTEQCAEAARAIPRVAALLCAPTGIECDSSTLPSHARKMVRSLLAKMVEVRPALKATVVALVRAMYEKSDRGFYWIARLLRDESVRIRLDASVARRRTSAHSFDLLLELGAMYFNQCSSVCQPDQLPLVRYTARLFGLLVDDYRHFRNGHRDAIVWHISAGLLLFREFSQRSRVGSLSGESGFVWNTRAIDTLMQNAQRLPDFVFDQHTRAGRSLKRGPEHFAQEGARVTREDDTLLDIDYRQVFFANKAIQEQDFKRRRGNENV